jgi:hypothetical protein
MLNNMLGTGPFKLLVERLNVDNSVKFPRVSGILPLNEFMSSHKIFSPVRFPKVNGIGPLKLFWVTYRPPKFSSIPKEEGRFPVNKLYEKSRVRKQIRRLTSSGILPEILLFPRVRMSREVERLEIESGRTPPNLLADNPSSCNWEQFVSWVMNSQSFGSLASNKFTWRRRNLSFSNLPISGEIMPLKKLPSS